jgi:hypothetical protein
VTDAGLDAFSSIPTLRELVLQESMVGDAAVARRHTAAPSLEITR